MAEFAETGPKPIAMPRSAARKATDGGQPLEREPQTRKLREISQLLNARPGVVAQRARVRQLSAGVTARSLFHSTVSKAKTQAVEGKDVVQRHVAVDAGNQTPLWNQWYAEFAAGNDALTEAQTEPAIHLNIIGDPDAGDAGRTQVAWNAAAQRTTIDILIETGDDIDADQNRETLGHELYLHAMPAIITHYNATNSGEVPVYVDPDDEEAFDAEEEAEHHDMDGWFQLFRSAVNIGDQGLRDRVIVNFLTHGNDLHVLMQAAIDAGVITAEVAAEIEEENEDGEV